MGVIWSARRREWLPMAGDPRSTPHSGLSRGLSHPNPPHPLLTEKRARARKDPYGDLQYWNLHP